MREESLEEKRYERVERHHHVLRISSTVPLTMLTSALIYGLGYWIGSGRSLLPDYGDRRKTALETNWTPPLSRYSDDDLFKGDKYVPAAKHLMGEDLSERMDIPGKIGGEGIVEWPVDSVVPLPR